MGDYEFELGEIIDQMNLINYNLGIIIKLLEEDVNARRFIRESTDYTKERRRA